MDAFGLLASEAKDIGDDAVCRALDRLFVADRGSLLTAAVVSAASAFGVRFDEMHNDSTTLRFCGQYRAARGDDSYEDVVLPGSPMDTQRTTARI